MGSALATCAEEQRRLRPDLIRLRVFGSFVRGGWGVGSDLALLVYTAEEFTRISAEDSRFGRVLREDQYRRTNAPAGTRLSASTAVILGVLGDADLDGRREDLQAQAYGSFIGGPGLLVELDRRADVRENLVEIGSLGLAPG